MKWFKHMSNSIRDEKLSLVVDEFGAEGYGAYWMILELIAEQLDEENKTFLEFSDKKWRSFLGFSPKKFQKYLDFLQKVGLFEVKKTQKQIAIDCPNLLKYRDNHTVRKARNYEVTTEKVPLDKDKDKDKEYIKKINKKNSCSPSSPGDGLDKNYSESISDQQINKSGSSGVVSGPWPDPGKPPSPESLDKNSVGSKPVRFDAKKITLPEGVDRGLWCDYIDVRKKLKAPNSERATKILVNTLVKLIGEGHEANGLIESALVNGWKGFYAPRNQAVKPAGGDIPYEKIVDLYNEILSPRLPSVSILDDQRKSQIRACWSLHENYQSLEFWADYFHFVQTSDFLMGKVAMRSDGQVFDCNFDFLTRDNFKRVFEGVYHKEGEC